MDILLGLLVLALIVIWLLVQVFKKKKREITRDNRDALQLNQTKPDANTLPNSSQIKTVTTLEFPFGREQDDLRTHAQMQAAFINHNSTDPDNEGFLRRKGNWQQDFIVKSMDGKVMHKGRIKLDGEYLAVVKERYDPTKKPIDLRRVQIE